MIRVAVLSDTHGGLDNLHRLSALLGPVDWLLHAGDHMQDAQEIGSRLLVEPERVRAVVGNCDYPLREPVHQAFPIGDVTVYLTHGHLFGVKQGLERLYYKAKELSADVAIFGHTHVAYQAEWNGVLLLNPGSATAPRPYGQLPSCGLLEIEGREVRAQILSLPG
ncbi:MAG: metallophosphoesterase [Mycobacterium leprae]